jgi:methyl-accepting chemotaxis protein
MKLKARLTITISVMTAVIISVLSVVLLSEARRIQITMTQRDMEGTTGLNARDLKAYYEEFMNTASVLAELMGEYETLEPELRRSQFSRDMIAVFRKNSSLVGLFTVWKPGVLDGLDSRYRNTPGSDGTGNFVPFYSRESGEVVLRATTGYEVMLEKLQNEQYLGDPAPQEVRGETVITVQFRAPITNSRGEAVGVVGVVADMSYSQTLVTGITPYEVGRAELYSTNGTILAAHDTNIIGRRFQDTKLDRMGVQGVRLIEQSLQDEKPVDFEYKGTMFQTYPLKIEEAPNPWLLIISAPMQTIMREVNGMTRFAVILAAGAILIAVACGFLASQQITRPIVKVSDTLRDISEGEGDLTKSITVKRKDEIGSLAHYFNLTLEKIRSLVATIKQQSALLFDIGGELADNMGKTAAAVNQISTNLQNIKSQVIGQSTGVSETSSTMEQITVNINKLNDHIENQSASIARSSSAIEEMLANIQSVTQTLVKNGDNVRVLIEAAGVGRTGLEEVSADIQGIARESEGLSEINAVMENIASQTNLLSMNAAIEAAHAGEAGRGFAVVAGEIRKLAESSSEQSKTISSALKKIKGSIDKITLSTRNVLDKFEAIDQGVQTVSEQSDNIRSAMEEQSAGSQQILESIGELNNISQLVKQGSEEMLEGSREVIKETKVLESVSSEISGGMNEMAAGAGQISEAVNRVNEASGQNKENIDILVKEVSRFKIE